jgi:predicted nucleic acid-binding protein
VPAVGVLDSNALDVLLEAPDLHDRVTDVLERELLRLMYTHVTRDEVAAVPDAARRTELLSLLTTIGELVPTGDFVVGYSRLGMARLSREDSAIDQLRSRRGDHVADALIAGTARFERGFLITYDRRLTNRATAVGIAVGTWEQLLNRLSSS